MRANLPSAALMLLCCMLHRSEGHGQAWEVFDMNTAGFPSNTVTDIVTGLDGVVWVATDWGLCRYQSGEWTVWQTGNSGLPDNVLRALAVSPEGHLWVGTTLHGVAVFDGSAWTYLNTANSPLPDDEVNRIVFDHRGWAWVATVGGLACWTGDQWHVYDDTPASHGGLVLNTAHVKDVAVRGDGLVMLGTMNGGLHYLTDTSVVYYTTFNDQFPDNTALGLVFDSQSNNRWLACPAAGLVQHGGDWLGGPWFVHNSANSGLPGNALLTLVQEQGSGALWIGTQMNGLVRRSPNGTYLTYSVANSGVPDNMVNRLHFAPADGRLWVGTQYGGAARFDPSTSLPERTGDAWQPGVFPNPCKGSFWIDAGPGMEAGSWLLSTHDGRELTSGRMAGRHTAVDAAMAPGTYLLRVVSGGRMAMVRLIVL